MQVKFLNNTQNVHISWLSILNNSLKKMDLSYLNYLLHSNDWLPGTNKVFNAFSLPLSQVKYILFGESPYPRPQSANGYAFWDAAVQNIWSETGFSKEVNRATSLRNFIKMLLLARGEFSHAPILQKDIANLDKSELVQNLSDLFMRFQEEGFLLLNASLVLAKPVQTKTQVRSVKKEAEHWLPFMENLLAELVKVNSSIQLILFGNIAKTIQKLNASSKFKQVIAEHPYNVSFITNPKVLNFFKPFDLLQAQPKK